MTVHRPGCGVDDEKTPRRLARFLKTRTHATLELPPLSEGYSRLGVALFKKGDLSGAQKAYAGGLACDPNNVQCNDGLAEVRAAKARKQAADKAADDLDQMSMDPSDRYVIGIDLGTTYSCVSVWKDGEAQVGRRSSRARVASNNQRRTCFAFPLERHRCATPRRASEAMMILLTVFLTPLV